MATAVTVTQIGQGVAGNRRFTDVVLELTGDLSQGQEDNGVALDIATVPLDEVTEVHILPTGDGRTGGAAVELVGTKSAPKFKFWVAKLTDGTLAQVEKDDAPPESIALRLFGA